MYTGVMVLLTVTTTDEERPMYFGLTGLTWGAGTILGPVIGGMFNYVSGHYSTFLALLISFVGHGEPAASMRVQQIFIR